MKWYVIILLSCLCVACKKHQTLEEATDKPMQKAIEEAVEEQYKNVKDVKIYALKTVYADDSVCIKQCYVDKIDRVGKKEVLDIAIKPEVVDPDDIEMLQDLVISAVNEALRKVDDMQSAQMGKLTGGMNIPGLF